jgi:hypothetical protein
MRTQNQNIFIMLHIHIGEETVMRIATGQWDV